MTPVGWLFMIASVAFVHSLLLFCIVRLVRGDGERKRNADKGT